MCIGKTCVVCGSKLSFFKIFWTGFSVSEHTFHCDTCGSKYKVDWKHGYIIMMAPTYLAAAMFFFTPLRDVIPLYLRLGILFAVMPFAMVIGTWSVPLALNQDDQ